jgi:hypothetical protein
LSGNKSYTCPICFKSIGQGSCLCAIIFIDRF